MSRSGKQFRPSVRRHGPKTAAPARVASGKRGGVSKFEVPEAVSDGIKRLKGNGEKEITWKALADKIGCSTATIQFWLDGTRRVLPKDALTLALLDRTFNEDSAVTAKHWLDACDEPVTLEEARARVDKRTRLTTNIEVALDKVRELAELKGLAKADFDMAL